MDLQSEHELFLTENAFYMRVNDDGRTVAAMDVLAPGIGEIIGGSQREERLAVLDARMVECTSTGSTTPGAAICAATYGAARGLRPRFRAHLAYVTGLADVRDTIPFPRTPGNARY